MPKLLVDSDIGHTWVDNTGYARMSIGNGDEQHVHRYVMEKRLGRKLVGRECVHHINRDKLDNRLENLKLCADDKEHARTHAIEDIVAAGYSFDTHSWCSYHQQYEPREEFSPNKGFWQGLNNNCRKATNEYRKEKGLYKTEFDWKARMNQQYRRAVRAGAASPL